VNHQRWVVLGLAHPRADWFSELARWATSAAAPIEFVKCMSAQEARVRLSSGRAHSAMLVGDRASGLDRDLVDSARSAGTAVIVVDPAHHRDWSDLGVSGVLHTPFDRSELVSALQQHATPVTTTEARVADSPTPLGTWRGQLVAVTGPGGAGSSTTAMALAQTLARRAGNAGMVLLADLALNAELAMLHDARDVVPGVQEMVDAHRGGRMTVERTRSLVFDTGDRGYHLLLGLRRHRDWTALRRKSFEATLDTLLRSYRLVIADITADFEGESETGSLDVADRNLMSRAVMERADAVVVVGTHGLKGIHSLARTIRDLLANHVEPERLVTVINRSPRHPSGRADDSLALANLVRPADGAEVLSGPVFTPDRRDLEAALRDAVRLPKSMGMTVSSEVERRLEDQPSRADLPIGLEPERVAPGSIGSWTEEAG